MKKILLSFFILFLPLLGQVAHATNIQWSVPYIGQFNGSTYLPNDPDGVPDNGYSVDVSACGPTSIAMLLRYYYKNSKADVVDTYHAGIEYYTFGTSNTGSPAACYRNMGWDGNNFHTTPNVTNCSVKPIPGSTNSSGLVMPSAVKFLKNIWGITVSDVITKQQDVLNELNNGPLLGHVWWNGTGPTANNGHYIVIIGKKSYSTTDDTIIINDPYNKTSTGANREIRSLDFFSSRWWQGAYKLNPPDKIDTDTSKYTVIVHVGNNGISGNSARHSFQLTDVNNDYSGYIWGLYYGNGNNWVQAGQLVSGHTATWTPLLTSSGNYDVSAIFPGDVNNNFVNYKIYDKSRKLLIVKSVNQYWPSQDWTSDKNLIASNVYLENGSYVTNLRVG
ncbi:exported hypothetical protein [Gammaproteobacteria bacterium]